METAFSTLPQLKSFGICLFDVVWRNHFHQNAACEFHFIRHGRLELHYEKSRYLAGPGDVILIPARTLHCDQFDINHDYEVYMASFSWPEAEEALFQAVDTPVVATLTDSQRAEIRQHLDLLYNCDSSDSGYEQALSQSHFHTILLLLLHFIAFNKVPAEGRQSSRQRRLRRNQWLIKEVKQYISKHFAQQLSLEDLAEVLDVSPYHLSRVFNGENGFSLSSYLTMVRMNQARNLLLAGRMNVSEVADAVGYPDSGYFSKVFRKHFGQSPSEMALARPARRT